MKNKSEFPVQRWLNIFFSLVQPPYITESLSLCRELGKTFHYELAAAILRHFHAALRNGETSFEELLTAFNEIADVSQTASYIATMLDRRKLAKMESDEETNQLTLAKLIDLDKTLGFPSPDLCLEIAKLYSSSEQRLAKRELQRALGTFPPYSFYLKSQRCVSELTQNMSVPFKRTVRLAVLGSATTSFLTPVFKAAALAKEIRLEIYEGAYRNYAQEILNLQSELYSFQPDAIVLLTESHDFSISPQISPQEADTYASQIRELWKCLLENSGSHIIQTGLEYPDAASWGSLEDALPDGRRRQIDRVNQQLSESLPNAVSFLNMNALAAQCESRWTNAREWQMAKQYPSSEATPLFADAVIAQIAAVFGMSKKMLILDLDNTCWGGVIGEDGLAGIKLGSTSAAGESFLELQRYAKDLKNRGVLLAVCSKNNEKDALLPFERHDEMILKKEDFVAFKANWNNKASNIREIAREVNLGLDSFVFLDDNPAERMIVRNELPEVAVPEFGRSHHLMLQALKRGLYFETLVLTDEDKNRHQSYLTRQKLQNVAESSVDLTRFLKNLKMKCYHGAVDELSLSRVAQLVNKTNQFNLTARRYTQRQISDMINDENWWCHWFRLDDNQQCHGIVGVILVRKQRETWIIDAWLMSCRVIGRRLESLMFKVLRNAARKEGCSQILGEYIPTEKNGLVKTLYPKLGFSPAKEENHYIYSFNQDDLSFHFADDSQFHSVEELIAAVPFG
ncbi:MAG: HAD-IIIC family phosphatase [Planctomycetaceae bacterium]|jgi:FkbH-like protein|nr:HAD-IIIC family phosphatase [Planctomycetaceae bacterium]